MNILFRMERLELYYILLYLRLQGRLFCYRNYNWLIEITWEIYLRTLLFLTSCLV